MKRRELTKQEEILLALVNFRASENEREIRSIIKDESILQRTIAWHALYEFARIKGFTNVLDYDALPEGHNTTQNQIILFLNNLIDNKK